MSKDEIQQSHNIRPFGYQLLLDCYDCDTQRINSIDACALFLDELTESIGMKKQSPPFIFQSPKEYPEKAGLSGWVPIIDSGIQIHTLTVTKFVSLDVYSCEEFDCDLVERAVKNFLKPRKIEVQYIERGKEYGEILERCRT